MNNQTTNNKIRHPYSILSYLCRLDVLSRFEHMYLLYASRRTRPCINSTVLLGFGNVSSTHTKCVRCDSGCEVNALFNMDAENL